MENNEEQEIYSNNEYKKVNLEQTTNTDTHDKRINNVQITYDMILESSRAKIKDTLTLNHTKIMEPEELEDYKKNKRVEFEDKLRRQRFQIGTWVTYAEWEIRLNEFERARSIYERALEVDYKNVSLWTRYAEFEMKNKFINHARNIWERAVTLLPRIDQFWFKYIYMEEFLGNYKICIEIFNKWMNWNPLEKAWMSYYNFLIRHKYFNKSRDLLYKLLINRPNLNTYLNVINLEISKNKYKEAELLFNKCINDIGEEANKDNFFKKWIYLYTIQNKYEEADKIFKLSFNRLKDGNLLRIKEEYTKFLNLYGNEKELENSIYEKRKNYYLNLLKLNSRNFDALIDLLFLEINNKGNPEYLINHIKDNQPLNNNKKVWKRYIFLYIIYANNLELNLNDLKECNSIFEYIINICFEKNLYFSVLLLNYAELNLRMKNLNKMRKIFGMCLYKYPKIKIIKKYIQIELDLGNIDRVRNIYEKYCEIHRNNPNSWLEYATLEKNLEEEKRCKEILKIAINSSDIDMPELVWKFFIDYEIELKNYDNVRSLYRDIISRTRNYKSYLSFALFEYNQNNIFKMRDIFLEGENYLKINKDFSKDRAKLLNIWLKLENKIGDPIEIEKLEKKQPKVEIQVKNINNDENENIFEEFEDFTFPDDIKIVKGSNLLRLAKQKK